MNIWFEDFDLKKPERETSNFSNDMISLLMKYHNNNNTTNIVSLLL